MRRHAADPSVRGIFLVLDELNGVASDPQFCALVKGLTDLNARVSEPVPLLLMLCATQERRRDMIRSSPSTDRIFDIVDIGPMGQDEVRQFFEGAFNSIQVRIAPSALALMVAISSGRPKIMHVVGDCCFWADQSPILGVDEAAAGMREAVSGKRDRSQVRGPAGLRGPSQPRLQVNAAENLRAVRYKRVPAV